MSVIVQTSTDDISSALKQLFPKKGEFYHRREFTSIIDRLYYSQRVQSWQQQYPHAVALGGLHCQLLQHSYELIQDGATGIQVDEAVRQWCVQHDITPAFIGFNGYPYACCVSLDATVLHGFPTNDTVIDCRIASIDIGVWSDGLVLDAAFSIAGVAAVDDDHALVADTFRSLLAGMSHCTVDNHIGDIGAAITAAQHHWSPCVEWKGHGVGSSMHVPPDVPQVGEPHTGEQLSSSSILAIEPILSAGNGTTVIADNGWDVVTADMAMSAHAEASVGVGTSPTVLTPWWEYIDYSVYSE